MATIIDRSPYAVSARNREDLYREFPYNKEHAAVAYADALKSEGLRASIKRLANQYQVQARKRGYPTFCQTVESWAEAQQLKLRIEAEQSCSIIRDYGSALRHTLSVLVKRYIDEVCPQHKGAESEIYRLRRILREETFVQKKLAEITTEDLMDFVNDRLGQVAPATVDRDLDVLAQVMNYADNVWKIAPSESPFKGLPRPKYFNERDRRLKSKEEKLLLQAARADENPYIEPIIVIALQTAMRRGEILSLKRNNIDFEARAALLPETKNGRPRKVPLSQVAIDLLRSLPETDDGRIFPVTANALKLAWSRRVLPKAKIDDLHFHDLRHEATSRLAESWQYTLLDLQAITGHRDVRMLQRYSHLCTRKLAERMDKALPKPAQTYIWRGRKRVLGTPRTEKENENYSGATSQPEQQTIKPAGNIIIFPARRKSQSLG